MAIDTKPNLSNRKFEQCSGDTMNLSGCTQIYGFFDIENAATLSICTDAATGKMLTSDSQGVATWQYLPTPSTITSGSTNSADGTTHNHCFDASTFVTGNQGILADGNNRFYLDDTYITNQTLTNLYTYTGVTANQSIGALPSGQTLGMVYITNSGSSTASVNLGTTPTGNDITPFQAIEVAPDEDVSVTVNMRLSQTENKTIYINSSDWTGVELKVQWANITYQNASTTINPGDLPVATESTIGAISVGDGLSIDGNGHLCATGGTGGGTITGGTNGLGTTGADICLGGVLNGNTAICATGFTCYDIVKGVNGLDYDGFSFNAPTSSVVSKGTPDFLCYSAVFLTHPCANIYSHNDNVGTCSCMGLGANGNIAITLSNILTITSENSCPAQYESDYSSAYTCLSIPNAGWVTGQTSGATGSVTGATNLGSGDGTLYTSISDKNLQFKTLSGGSSIGITSDANYVGISVTGGSGGFLGLVTKDTTEPNDLADNQWVKPEPMSTDCFNYTFDNFLGSGGTSISVNLSLCDTYLRYCSTGDTGGYWINEGYCKPLSSGYTWVGNDNSKAAEVAVINEWVNTVDDLCYAGQKYAYQTQTIFQVDVGCCVTMPNKILVTGLTLSSLGSTCIFTIPTGMYGMISSAKLIMLNDATPDSVTVSIGNNSTSYNNMLSSCTIDDMLCCEVYELLPTSLPACAASQSTGGDVYFRVNTAASGGTLNANLLFEGHVF